MGLCIWSESFWPEKGKYRASDKEDLFSFPPIIFSLNSLDFFSFNTKLVKNDGVNDMTW